MATAVQQLRSEQPCHACCREGCCGAALALFCAVDLRGCFPRRPRAQKAPFPLLFCSILRVTNIAISSCDDKMHVCIWLCVCVCVCFVVCLFFFSQVQGRIRGDAQPMAAETAGCRAPALSSRALSDWHGCYVWPSRRQWAEAMREHGQCVQGAPFLPEFVWGWFPAHGTFCCYLFSSLLYVVVTTAEDSLESVVKV